TLSAPCNLPPRTIVPIGLSPRPKGESAPSFPFEPAVVPGTPAHRSGKRRQKSRYPPRHRKNAPTFHAFAVHMCRCSPLAEFEPLSPEAATIGLALRGVTAAHRAY